MELHQGMGAQILAFAQRVHDCEMLVDRSLDALDAVDPLNVEERAQAVLALHRIEQIAIARTAGEPFVKFGVYRSEEHTSELQSLMRILYAVFCLKKKIIYNQYELHTCLYTTHHKSLHIL